MSRLFDRVLPEAQAKGFSEENVNLPAQSEGLARYVSGRQATLEILMERYQQADPAAVQALIATLTPVLLRFFRYRGCRLDQAEDLVQDTWLRIHRVRHTYRPREPLLPWIFTMARRVRVDYFRRNVPIRIHEVSSGVLPEAAAPRSDLGTLRTLLTLMDALPAAQRDVILMLKAEGLSIEEVARAMGITPGAVKQKAHRAYRKLRELLQPGLPKMSAGGQRRDGLPPIRRSSGGSRVPVSR